MLLFHSKANNPFYNLAMEDHLLHTEKEDVVLIYVNKPSVVIGKHQNVFDECRINYCRANHIEIARRLSGGGTVFHGPGNINFSFIQNLKPGDQLVDFKKHLQPIIDFLNTIGIDAKYSGRNDLLLDGYKISGSAQHVYQKEKRVIHHGTLLFMADLKLLPYAIKPKKAIEFTGHAVKSIRSKVANISDYLTRQLTENQFIDELINYLGLRFSASVTQLDAQAVRSVKKLAHEKYNSWDWVFGYSPAFEAITIDGWLFKVANGIIGFAEYKGNVMADLVGMRYSEETFAEIQHDRWF